MLRRDELRDSLVFDQDPALPVPPLLRPYDPYQKQSEDE